MWEIPSSVRLGDAGTFEDYAGLLGASISQTWYICLRLEKLGRQPDTSHSLCILRMKRDTHGCCVLKLHLHYQQDSR